MDIEKLNLIKKHVITFPLEDKPASSEFAGLFLHSNSPFKMEDYYGPVRSFRAFSEFKYPIYFFISSDAITNDFYALLNLFPDIHVIKIRTLNSIIEFNNFELNNMLYLLPSEVENLVYVQSDGFCLKSGWEPIARQYDYIGALWKEPIRVIEDTFKLPPVQIGNGGCGFRRKSKCLEIIETVEKHGGQEEIVRGLEIYKNPIQFQHGSFLAEDLFFCYFGFGLGIFKPTPKEIANTFAHEPVSFELATGNSPDKPFFFHRVDY